MISIAGITPFTTIDYPDKLSAVLFCQGCPWQCTYCHNPALQAFSYDSDNWPQVMDFLHSRQNLLEAVVFSGGEPLAQPKLLQAITEVKNLGFAVGLHTGGCSPSLFKTVLPFIDWIGFDFKAPLVDYFTIIQRKASASIIQNSLSLLLNSHKAFEIRTTVAASLHRDTLFSMANYLQSQQISTWIWQTCLGNFDSSLHMNKHQLQQLAEQISLDHPQLKIHIR